MGKEDEASGGGVLARDDGIDVVGLLGIGKGIRFKNDLGGKSQ